MIRLHHLFDSALHMSSRVHFDSISITILRNPEETLIAGKVMGVGSKQKPPAEMLQRFHRLPSREVTYPLPAGTFKPMIFLFPSGGICLLILELFFLKKNPSTFFCCWWWRLDEGKVPQVQRRNQPHPHRTTTSFQSMVATLKATVMDFFLSIRCLRWMKVNWLPFVRMGSTPPWN